MRLGRWAPFALLAIVLSLLIGDGYRLARATETFSNTAQSTISHGGGYTSGATSIVLASTSSFPATGNFRIKIGSEILLATANNTGTATLTVTRAQESTSAAAISDGATVTHVLTAGALTQLEADAFTAGGDLSGSATSQTVAKANGATVPAAGSLTTGNVLYVSGSSALSYGNIAGDVTGAITGVTVAKANGATIPAAGSLTTGNTLAVTGASALGYSALNLAGGAGYVSGVLPPANGGLRLDGATVTTGESTSSSSYADLTTGGPSVTMVTNTAAIVCGTAAVSKSTTGNTGWISVDVSSATTTAAADANGSGAASAIASGNFTAAFCTKLTLTAGSNVFKLRYRTDGGTFTFSNRRITVTAANGFADASGWVLIAFAVAAIAGRSLRRYRPDNDNDSPFLADVA